jgi:hypothetical protein
MRAAVTDSKNKQLDMESRVDNLEKRLKEKIEVLSGFADAGIRARKLQQQFQIFDTNNSGIFLHL